MEHPLIRPGTLEFREYQVAIARSALRGNTLVVLPTGLGKTAIAAMVLAERLAVDPTGRALVMAPTRPLALQHLKSLRSILALREDSIVLMTGEIPPDRRREIWSGQARVLVATPQVVRNDLISGSADLSRFRVVVFDEAHRAVGSYPYVQVADRYAKVPDGLILALTASPGSDPERLREMLTNLRVERAEVRDRFSPDVRPYVSRLVVEWKRVPLPPPYREALERLNSALRKVYSDLASLGVALGGDPNLKTLLEAQARLSGSQSPEGRAAAARVALAIKLRHLRDVLWTQGPVQALSYLERVARGRKSASDRMLLELPEVRDLIKVLSSIPGGFRHPKVAEVKRLVAGLLADNPGAKVIVFTNYRDTANVLLRELSDMSGVRPVRFFGQAPREGERGMTQAEQRSVLESFSSGEKNVLLATSVGEEGLDIPEVDLVIFYDPVPSEIRHIQRKGRTGRGRPGRVVVLLSGRREEALYWKAVRRERTSADVIRRILGEIRETWSRRALREGRGSAVLPTSEAAGESRIPRLEVVVDARELGSEVARRLADFPDVRLKVRALGSADYIVSERVAVERKTVDDLAASLVDGRLFEQAFRMRDLYEVPILLVEGRDPFHPSRRAVNPRSLMGAAATLALSGIGILWSPDGAHTAELIRLLARREQMGGRRRYEIKSPKPRSEEEVAERVLAAIPGVGLERARILLSEFGSLRRVFQASKEELSSLGGIGPATAESIFNVLDRPYRRGEETSGGGD